MSYIWQTRLGQDVPYDSQYHDNARVEIASFISEPPGLVLDIGCGGGTTGRLIKQKFPGTRVVGIERNPHAAERAREFLER
jgi:trans-aconitate methyltransferase